MDCERVAQFLEPFFDGELPPDLAQEVERSLESCAHCQAELAMLASMRESLRAPVIAEMAEVDLGGLWARIESELPPEPVRLPVRAPVVEPRRQTEHEQGPDWLGRVLGALRDVFSRPLVPFALAGAAALVAVLLVQRTADDAESPEAGGIASSGGALGAPDSVDNADNTAYVSSVTVKSGWVLIDQVPDDPTAPLIVWHIEENGGEDDSSQGG